MSMVLDEHAIQNCRVDGAWRLLLRPVEVLVVAGVA